MEEVSLDSGLVYYRKAEQLARKIDHPYSLGTSIGAIGIIHCRRGNYPESMLLGMEALQIFEKLNAKSEIANALVNIGIVHKFQGNYTQAIQNYLKAKTIYEELGDQEPLATIYGNISSTYASGNKPDSLIYYVKKSIAIAEQLNDEILMASGYVNLGIGYDMKNEFDAALSCYRKARDLFLKIGINHAAAFTERNMADVCIKKNEPLEAISLLDNALKIFIAEKLDDDIKETYASYANAYTVMKDYKTALEYFRKYSGLKDTLYSQESTQAVAEMEQKYQSEKREQEIKLQAEEIKRNEAEIGKQTLQKVLFAGGLVAALLIALFIFRSYKKQRLLTAIIEETNRNITDSINYAKRIQEAMLPEKELKQRLFPDSFILFQPKDVVSGDFFWFGEKNGKKIIAAVDCTGHGVPGAFMSMIGNAFLNEIVLEKGITKPGEILSELRFLVKKALKQTGAEGETRDGMDMSLLCFENERMEFSGANNPVWILRSGSDTIQIIKGDKRPIGYHKGQGLPFTNHEIKLSKGDSVYIFSDGMADQFGGLPSSGSGGKKFKYKQLQKDLLSIKDKPMPEQEAYLQNKFNAWKGNLEQVDDVLVIGIRV